MRRRIAGIAVIAVGLMLALAGCTFFAPQATLIPYDASDGVGINVGDIQLRNALAISPDGTDANLVGVFINTSTTAKSVKVQYTSHASGKSTQVTEMVKLAGNGTISYGNPGVPQLVFAAADIKPGSLLKLFVQYGGVSGKLVYVPVLDGSQTIYSDLTPSPTPIPTLGPTSTPTPKATEVTN